MAASSSYETFPISDAAALAAFGELASEANLESPHVHFEIMDRMGGGEFDLLTIDKQPMAQVILADDTATTLRNLAVRFKGRDGQGSVRINRADGPTKVHIDLPEAFPPSRAFELLRLVQKRFRPFHRVAAIEHSLGPELAQYYRNREEALLKLEDLTQRLTEQNEQYRREVDLEVQRLRDRLREETKQTELELKGVYDERLRQVEERQQALAAREKELDDRSARFVRRDAVKGLKQIIANREKSFKLTTDTEKKREPVFYTFIALLLVSAVVLGFGIFRSPSEAATGPSLWLQLARIPVGFAGFALTALFFIRWNDNWARQHADEEFRLRQLELDIDRASWVTELALEFKDEKGDLSTALLDRLSAGLFTAYRSEPVRHPTQDVLSALFGESNRLRLKSPLGIEADISRRGVRRAEDRLRDAQGS